MEQGKTWRKARDRAGTDRSKSKPRKINGRISRAPGLHSPAGMSGTAFPPLLPGLCPVHGLTGLFRHGGALDHCAP